MTEKIVIKAEQVVSRKGGYVSYYDEGSALRKAKADTVTVLEPGQETPVQEGLTKSPSTDSLPPVDSNPVASPSSPVGQLPEGDVTITTPATESKHKPSKRGNKPKEDADMATKTAEKKSAPKKAPAKKAPAKKAPAKKAAPALAPHAPKEGGSVRTIGGKPVDISKYEKVKAPGGGTSYHNGDAVAEKLQGKTLDQVYEIVAKSLKCDVSELVKKYKDLNVGMQRMNLGNRLRKVLMAKEAK